jgi:hypothetical protein
MDWIKTFPYKIQLSQITLGFTIFTCGTVFYLISFGMKTSLWITMAVTSLCIGTMCVSAGAIWCYYVIHRSPTDKDSGVRVKNGEVETLTSEATEMIK